MKKLTRLSLDWHRSLRWFGGITILIWAISGAIHPIMSWTGPKALSFFPPKFALASEQIQSLPNSIQQARDSLGIDQARVVKIVPSEQGPLLQITQDLHAQRQYVNLNSGEFLPEYDEQHAKWLGQYYTGRQASEIKHIERLEQFTPQYPSVNRLLPVYRIHYSGDDGLVAYVHTETNALASLSNSWRDVLQGVFRLLHTWNWMDGTGFGRVFIIALLSISMIAMAITGIALVFTFKSRKIVDVKRRWHRRIAYLIWLPLLGWSISGFYHLLQAEYVKRPMGMHLDKAFSLSNDFQLADLGNLDQFQGAKINAMTLVRGRDDESLLRVSFARDNAKKITREMKYKGQMSEASSLYWNLQQGAIVELDDRSRALWLAKEYAEVSDDKLMGAKIITRFGPEYDFRNKRLPVWHVQVDDAFKTSLFIDPTTGILVDQNRKIDRAESLSFSILHKWNFFNAFTTRKVRDIVVVIFLAVSVIFTVFGMLIHVRKTRKRAYAMEPAVKESVAD